MGERTEAQVNDAREVGLAILRRIHATKQAPVKVAAKAGIFHANEKLSGAEDFTARDVLRILEVLTLHPSARSLADATRLDRSTSVRPHSC